MSAEHTPVALCGGLRATLGPDGKYYDYYILPPFGAVLWDQVPIPAGEHTRAANEPSNTG